MESLFDQYETLIQNSNLLDSERQTSDPLQDSAFLCRWSNPACTMAFDSIESLFCHISDFHIGRKRTSNLTLTCRWDNCETEFGKRDHIISHVKTHVPIRPYPCQHCGRRFKRKTDLSKHFKACKMLKTPSSSVQHSPAQTPSAVDLAETPIHERHESLPVIQLKEHDIHDLLSVGSLYSDFVPWSFDSRIVGFDGLHNIESGNPCFSRRRQSLHSLAEFIKDIQSNSSS